MLKNIKSVFTFALLMTGFAANASHIFITDPSINGIALDSVSGFTHPTINAMVGSTLKLTAGFYDHVNGSGTENWNMHFSKKSGSLKLIDFNQVITPSSNSSAPLYVSFSQYLSSVGTWVGSFEPIQSMSCPSFRYANGNEGGNGCGSPSESLSFTLNVTNFITTPTSGTVPEPGSAALIGLGLLGFAALRLKK